MPNHHRLVAISYDWPKSKIWQLSLIADTHFPKYETVTKYYRGTAKVLLK